MLKERITISSNWEWRLSRTNKPQIAESVRNLEKWSSVSQFPSVIQMELLHGKYIPDPDIGENEYQMQWAGEADWEYRTTFQVPKGSDNFVDLVFEGLDTFATVKLNGKVILETDNMFIPYRVNVKDVIQEQNELLIHFDSAVKRGADIEDKFGKRDSMMRSAKRMHERKSQYHWGWDWGPIVVTAGPWLPIHFESYTSRIDNMHITSDLATDHTSAEISVVVETSKNISGSAELEIMDENKQVIIKETREVVDDKVTFKSMINDPQLWWPNGEGPAALYIATIKLLKNSSVLDIISTRFGVRTISLIQRPLDDEPGKTFLFNVNGRDIFIQGGDWIPADNLVPRISREKYFKWLRLAQNGNLNMLRVWGGGIYETEDFYDAADECGILVWQDYTFACGDYPTHTEFLESVSAEVRAQTKRIRNRASLALLCGGNEDFMLKDWVGKPYDLDDLTGPFDKTDFPQRQIYLGLLPKIAAELAPTTQYWANSPFSGKGLSANDLTVGDIHQWDVWHLKQLPYQEYTNISGRFVSEFGMHGFPDIRTVYEFTPDAKDRHPQSRVIDTHNKGHGSEFRIARYLAENFRYSQKLEDFVYASQLLQSEAYGYALRDWKRKFNGKGKEGCAGALIWQFNDCYPCTSWAFVDYHLRPKPAFYTIRRTCAPISIGISRSPLLRTINDDKPMESKIPIFSIFAHNTTSNPTSAKLHLKAYDMYTGKYIELAEPDKSVELLPGQNTELGNLKNPKEFSEDSLIVLRATLVADDGSVLSRFVNWPEPFRYLTWPTDTAVSVDVRKSDAEHGQWEDVVILSANHPIKGVLLSAGFEEGKGESLEDPEWEDNMVDLMPGEELAIGVRKLAGRKLTWRFLGDWEL